MKKLKQQLLIEQLDRKFQVIKSVDLFVVPEQGWVNCIRKALKMSLRQLAERMNITPQSVNDIEEREKRGTITLKALREVAKALRMKVVYGFVPIDGSLEQMIEKRAYRIAKDVVMRTSQSMKLEDQENSKIRIEKAIQDRMEEIKHEMPRYLWD